MLMEQTGRTRANEERESRTAGVAMSVLGLLSFRGFAWALSMCKGSTSCERTAAALSANLVEQQCSSDRGVQR